MMLLQELRAALAGAALAWVSFLPGSAQADDRCAFASEPRLVAQDEEGTYLLWEEPEKAAFHGPELPPAPALESFRKWAQGQARDVDPTDPFALLRRQRARYLEAFGPRAVKNYDLLLERKAGRIESIRCLEALLLAAHEARSPQEKKPSEFQAYILRRALRHRGAKIKIHLLSGDDLVAPYSSRFKQGLLNDLRAGWRLWAHLHNHPFIFDNPSGDIAGTVIPSGDGTIADVATYLDLRRHHGLEEAWVTNGFSTLRLKAEELDLFR